MNRQEFRQAVLGRAREAFGEGYTVELQEIRKNNGTSYQGMTVYREGGLGSPTFNLDRMWERYGESMTEDKVRDAVEEIVRDYQEAEEEVPEDVKDLTELSKVCGKILYKLVNYGKNEAFLKTVPHRRFGDMAVVYYVSMKRTKEEAMSVTVSQLLMDLWGVTEEDLYQLAEVNTVRELPAELFSMEDVLNTFKRELGVDQESGLETKDLEEGCPMYVLSNQTQCLGAVSILYQGELERAAKRIGSDLVILPSSLHEVILLPMREGMDYTELRYMVRTINSTEVLPEEVLSEEVYCYRQSDGKIRMIPDEGPEGR